MGILARWAVLICLILPCGRLRCQSQQNDLSLRAAIVDQSYCHEDDEVFRVRLRIKLHFTNVSEHPVILARAVESPAIVRAAKTVQDAEKENFEYAPNVDDFPTERPASPQFGKKPDSEHFITLSPNEGYDTTVISWVFGVTTAKIPDRSGLLTKGKHLLQVGVRTWPYQWPDFESRTDVRTLKKRWRRYGNLVNGLVYSDLLVFAIPEEFDNPPCTPVSR
jgi:hypothetical protein